MFDGGLNGLGQVFNGGVSGGALAIVQEMPRQYFTFRIVAHKKWTAIHSPERASTTDQRFLLW